MNTQTAQPAAGAEQPSRAWIKARPEYAAVLAAEAEYLAQHPKLAPLWQAWVEAADAMADPARQDETDWEQASYVICGAMPAWFSTAMADLIGRKVDAGEIAMRDWRAGVR